MNEQQYPNKSRVLIAADTYGTILLYAPTGARAGSYYVDCGKIPERDVPKWRWFTQTELDALNKPALEVYPKAVFLAITSMYQQEIKERVERKRMHRAYANAELLAYTPALATVASGEGLAAA